MTCRTLYTPAPTADELNAHLARGGSVIVQTHTRATHYRPKHAGMFRQLKTGALGVQHGRGCLALTLPNGAPIVAIRLDQPPA